MRNVTALLVALLLATACSSAPSAGSAISGQPMTPALNAPSTPTPPCASLPFNWQRRLPGRVQSFTLASKAPGGGMIAHSTHPPDARVFTIDNLASGQHSFKVMAAYDNGQYQIFDLGSVSIAESSCLLIELSPSTTPVPPTDRPETESGLRIFGYGAFTDADADVLIDLPWREAQAMAHAAGWHTQVIFTVEGEMFPMSADLSVGRLRLIVVGGEEVGTVTHVHNS